MNIYEKKKNTFKKIKIINNKIDNNLLDDNYDIYFYDLGDNEKINIKINYFLKNIYNSHKVFGVRLKTNDELISIINHSILEKINYYLIDENILNNKDIYFLFLIGKKICINVDNKKNIDMLISNPCISHIICDSLSNKIKNNLLYNDNTFHFDVNKYCNYIKKYNYKEIILKNINKVWGYFSSYYIFNLDKKLTNIEIEDIYNTLSSNLGKIINCRPVNNSSIKSSYTRDVKFIPNSSHFYSSNIMQPLHTDYAYFTYEKAPDFLTLFCYKKSEYGGITSLITTKKIKEIMKKYNPDLYSRVIDLDFTYSSQVDEEGNFEIHKKKFFDENTNYINWNYFQIKEKYNDISKITLRNEIFKFFNEIISKGVMYDLSIKWERGDCILFNDHLNLHTRTAFLGERWLSGNAFFEK